MYLACCYFLSQYTGQVVTHDHIFKNPLSPGCDFAVARVFEHGLPTQLAFTKRLIQPARYSVLLSNYNLKYKKCFNLPRSPLRVNVFHSLLSNMHNIKAYVR